MAKTTTLAEIEDKYDVLCYKVILFILVNSFILALLLTFENLDNLLLSFTYLIICIGDCIIVDILIYSLTKIKRFERE